MNILPDLLLLIYLTYGMIHIVCGVKLKEWYIVLLYFFLLKILFNYDKCTISYIECKIRGVKKEEGYLYRFIDKFIRIRDRCYIFVMLLTCTLIISYNYFGKGGSICFK